MSAVQARERLNGRQFKLFGLSATNANLYGKAKSAYSSYFRDITSGSNGLYTATLGYDFVTGLGSPLTDNFNSTLTVSPTSGPAGASITLNGSRLHCEQFSKHFIPKPINFLLGLQ